MAYSKIVIEFLSVPNVNDVLHVSETKLGLNLNEIFRTTRNATGQVAIPPATEHLYKMTISATADISNIDVGFTPALTGNFTKVSLSSILMNDNLDGTHTYELNSKTKPTIYDAVSQNAILWPEGEFLYYAAVDNSYSAFISDNYKTAFNLDYNSSSLFTVTATTGSSGSGVGSVIVTAKYENAVFVLNNASPGINVVITNEAATPPVFYFVSETFSAAATPNTHVRVNVTTNELATKITSPVVVNGNTNNPFYVDVLRGSTNVFTAENSAAVSFSKTIAAPKLLDANNFTITVSNSPNGGTATITETVASGLTLQYSLDNITFQNQNVFSGLAPGDFVAYIKDNLGGLITKLFSVSEFGIYTPYFYISKSNSIRYANRVTWGDAANYKNDENTLGCEVDVNVAYNGLQNFQTADVITTQFKSNYKVNTAKIIKADQSEINLPIVKMSNNIGIKDKRDGYKYSLGNGKVGVYFLAGNVYDYDTNAVVTTHSMAGTLPEWAEVGKYIVIANAWFIIEEIFYDEIKSADVIVFSENYTGPEVAVIAGSIYNIFNYEVYEFEIDMVNYFNQTIQVQIDNTDIHFESVKHLSEKLDIKVRHSSSLEIRYWNDDNTDVFYATGIRHLIRMPITKVEGVSEEESETHKTDTTALLLSAELYEVDKFNFEPVSKEIWRKLIIALSHKNVFLDGVQYVKNGNFETEGPLDESNLYVLKASMLKTGIVYNADSSESIDFNTGSIEIPGLIETEIGFVKY